MEPLPFDFCLKVISTPLSDLNTHPVSFELSKIWTYQGREVEVKNDEEKEKTLSDLFYL